MDLYSQTSYQLSQHLTNRYSTSFSLSSRLFSRHIRPHIYAIYGLARIADEIVDTYQGDSAARLLDELEGHTESTLEIGYSPNPIVQSFICSAKKYNIGTDLTRPFFASMRLDLTPQNYSDELYRDYIYGSAEVIGLMCLKVFTDGDNNHYENLSAGAAALGSAYQKVNFLRDMKDDFSRLGRIYFPGIEFETFNNEQKQAIEQDIEQDFLKAHAAIDKLPPSAKRAVSLSYDYYFALFNKIKRADAETIKTSRLRLSNPHKLLLLGKRLAR